MPTAKKSTHRKTASKKIAVRKKAANNETNYLTKRILTSATRTGFINAAAETMEVMGYNVIVQRGWIVKKFSDGHIEKIEKLPVTNTSIALD